MCVEASALGAGWCTFGAHLGTGHQLGGGDNILKNRDIILPTKVHLVKAMVFPVVMCGYESWSIKKVESGRTDVFELW